MRNLSPAERCSRVAALQNGVLSRAQALACGLSRDQIHRLVASGKWDVMLPGVHRPAGAPEMWEQRLSAAGLWAGPTSAISHRSAAALWVLAGSEEGWVEISSLRRQRADGVIVHRVKDLSSADVTVCRGIPSTTPARTLADLAAIWSPEVLEVALEDALRRRLVTTARMQWTLERLGRSGRAGTRALRRLLSDRGSGYSTTESPLETRVLRLIRESGLPEPVKQHEVRAGDLVLARVDLAYPAARVAIEADGYRFHTHRADWQRERRVQNALTARDWLVVRVTWEDVERRPREVVAQVKAALALRAT